MAAVVALGALRHAFMARLAEWAFAVVMTLIGVVLLMPEERFSGDMWVAYRFASEDGLGLFFTLLGGMRLVILGANGSFRPMYHFRALTALACAVIWFSMTLAFMSSGRIGIWLAIFPVLFVFDTVNVFRATGDAAAADRTARVGARHGTDA